MITKNELIKMFEAGFTVGETPFEDNLMVDKDKTEDNKLYLWAYDTNMMPTNFNDWSMFYQDEVVMQVLSNPKLRSISIEVYIDGTQITEARDD